MKRVLLLVKGLGRGGAEHIVSQSARLGDSSRFTYEVAYVLPHKDALVHDLSIARIPVHRVGRSSGALVPRLDRLLRERDIDIVHAHSPVPAVAARFVTGRRDIRLVYTEHNSWGRYHPLTRWANAATFLRNDHVFAVSNDVRRSIASSRLGRRHARVEVLRHGLAPDFGAAWRSSDGVREELGIGRDEPIVVCVANFKPHKGHEHLLRAATIVRSARPEARFVLAGVGREEARTRALASDLGLDRTVIFAGFREDAPRLIRAADVFVLPSVREGLPIALLEAMALGRPSVATAVGGVPDVVTDAEALLVAPADPEALAEGVVTLLDDEGYRQRMGHAAAARAADFDIRTAIRRIEAVYEELLT